MPAMTKYGVKRWPLAVAMMILTSVARSAPLDWAAVGELARIGNYTVLDEKLSAVQTRYERGDLSETDLRDSFNAFRDTRSDLSENLRAWTRQMPASYVAHLSSGIYYITQALRARGDKYAADTSPNAFAEMKRLFAIAAAEMNASLDLTKQPLLTHLYALDVSTFVGSKGDSRRVLDAGLKSAPSSVLLRERYMKTLVTRWGGGPDVMLAFLKECERSRLPAPAMSRLQALVLGDQAWVAQVKEEEPLKAAELYLRAFELTSDIGCAVCAAGAYMDANEYALAVEAFDKADRTQPLDAQNLYLRGMSLIYANKRARARSDLEKSADMGYAPGQFALGQALSLGNFGAPETALGTAWIRKAASQGYDEAVEWLAINVGR
jgi:TPR repeat protein